MSEVASRTAVAAVYDAIVAAGQAGTTTRRIEAATGYARSPVCLAMRELLRQGKIEHTEGRGTRVRWGLPGIRARYEARGLPLAVTRRNWQAPTLPKEFVASVWDLGRI